MIDFYEEQKSGVLHEYLSLSMCNETDGYVIGNMILKQRSIFLFTINEQVLRGISVGSIMIC